MRWILLTALGLMQPSGSMGFANRRLQIFQSKPQSPILCMARLGNHLTDVDDDPPKQKRLTWEESYELLCQYKQIHGHCNVPQSQKPLGSFVNRQRIDHVRFIDPNSKKPTAMTPRRKKLLEEIGFVWDNMEQTWNIRYEELCEFRKKNGHAVVPRSHGELFFE